MTKTIQIKGKGHTTLPLDAILEFQGKLKSMSKENLDKLKNLITTQGYTAPMFVWDDHGDYKLLDGHGRLKALISLRQDGYDIPMIPVDIINAKSEDEARRMLLAITSQFGEFEAAELKEWLDQIDSDVKETIRLVDGEIKEKKVNIPYFEEEAEQNQVVEKCCPACGYKW